MDPFVRGFKWFSYALGIFVVVGLVFGIIGRFIPEQRVVYIEKPRPESHATIDPDRWGDIAEDPKEYVPVPLTKQGEEFVALMKSVLPMLDEEAIHDHLRRFGDNLKASNAKAKKAIDMAKVTKGERHKMYVAEARSHLAHSKKWQKVSQIFVAEAFRRVKKNPPEMLETDDLSA